MWIIGGIIEDRCDFNMPHTMFLIKVFPKMEIQIKLKNLELYFFNHCLMMRKTIALPSNKYANGSLVSSMHLE